MDLIIAFILIFIIVVAIISLIVALMYRFKAKDNEYWLKEMRRRGMYNN